MPVRSSNGARRSATIAVDSSDNPASTENTIASVTFTRIIRENTAPWPSVRNHRASV